MSQYRVINQNSPDNEYEIGDILWKWESSICNNLNPFYFNKRTGKYTSVTNPESFIYLFEEIKEEMNTDFKVGDKVKDITGKVGIVHSIDISKVYPVNVFFENQDKIESYTLKGRWSVNSPIVIEKIKNNIMTNFKVGDEVYMTTPNSKTTFYKKGIVESTKSKMKIYPIRVYFSEYKEYAHFTENGELLKGEGIRLFKKEIEDKSVYFKKGMTVYSETYGEGIVILTKENDKDMLKNALDLLVQFKSNRLITYTFDGRLSTTHHVSLSQKPLPEIKNKPINEKQEIDITHEKMISDFLEKILEKSIVTEKDETLHIKVKDLMSVMADSKIFKPKLKTPTCPCCKINPVSTAKGMCEACSPYW